MSNVEGRGIDNGGGLVGPFGSGDIAISTNGIADRRQLGHSLVYITGVAPSFILNTDDVVPFDAEAHDTSGWHNLTNPERLTVPDEWIGYTVSTGSKVVVGAQIAAGMGGTIKWYNSSDALQDTVGIQNMRSGSVSNLLALCFYGFPVVVASGDYFTLSVLNKSATTPSTIGLNGTTFWAEVLGKVGE